MTLAIQTLFLRCSFVPHKPRSSLGLTPSLAPIVQKPSKREQAGAPLASSETITVLNVLCVWSISTLLAWKVRTLLLGSPVNMQSTHVDL